MSSPRLSARSAIDRATGATAFQLLGTRYLLWLLVGATFVTVVRVDVLGVNLRLEHFVLLACLVGLVLQGRTRALFDVMGDRTLLLFGAFIVWSAGIAILQAPSPGASLLIVGWLALDWLLLAVLASTADDGPQLAGEGATWAGVTGAVALAAWIAAGMAGTAFGVTEESEVLFGARSAFGLSFEPNLLGATMALWAFIACTGSTRFSPRARRLVVAIAIAAIFVSFTRAAGVGLLAGLVVWSALGGWRAVRRSAVLIASVVATMVLLATFPPKLAEPFVRRASQAFDFESGTGELRLAYWEAALDDLQGYDRLFGLGANTFGLRHRDVTDPTKPAYLSNLPLQVLYETGIVGVVLLSGTVVSLFTRRRLRDGRALGLLAVFLVCASATSPFHYGTTWVLVAIAVVDRRRHDAGYRSAPARVVRPAVATPVR